MYTTNNKAAHDNTTIPMPGGIQALGTKRPQFYGFDQTITVVLVYVNDILLNATWRYF